jgi:hypothetical protein
VPAGFLDPDPSAGKIDEWLWRSAQETAPTHPVEVESEQEPPP